MKVGTDGVLLGAWTNTYDAKEILDIGTGTGIIALMMAQRSSANITAVEMNTEAAEQAIENFQISDWSTRLTAINNSVQDFANHCIQKFDLIVCNPPYFSKSMTPPDFAREQARHDKTLNMTELSLSVKKLLRNNGVFSTIYPAAEAEKFIDQAMEVELYIKRKLNVIPVPGKGPKRILMEFCSHKDDFSEEYLTIEENGRHDYSKEYIELTKDFYLNF